MAQRLNKKLVVGLTITAMVLMTICGFALIYMLPPPDPAPFVEQGRKFEAEKQYEQAMLAYGKAAERAHKAMLKISNQSEKDRLRQDMTEYRIRAGDMAYNAGKAGNALQLWRVVLRDDPGHEVAHLRILNLYMDIYRLLGGMSGQEWANVEEQARQLSELNEENPNPVGLGCWGLALIKQRGVRAENAVEGEKLLKQAFELDKSNPDLARYLAEWHLEEARNLLSSARPQETYQQAEARIRDAEGVYEQLKANLPADTKRASTAWLHRGRFYLELRTLLWARLQMFRRGTTLGGSEADLLKQFAEADRQCLESLQQAAQLDPSDDKSLWAMGDYWAYKPSIERDEDRRKSETDTHQAQAIEAYKKAIHAAPDEFDAYLRLASLYRAMGKAAEAGDVLQARIDRGIARGTHLEFRNRLYMLKFREELFDVRMAQTGGLSRDSEQFASLVKDLKEVQYPAYVSEAEGREENGIAKFMRGRLYMLEGNYPRALELLEEANTVTGSSDLRIQLMLAQLYQINRVPAKAEELLRGLTQSAALNNDAAWTLLANVQHALGKHEEAENAADKALKLNPQNRDAMLILAAIYRSRNNEAGLEAIRRRLNLQEQPADKAFEEAAALLQGKTEDMLDPAVIDQAKAKLHETLKLDPTHFGALRALSILLAVKPEDAEELRAEKSQELKAAIDRALAAIDGKLAESAANPSAAAETAEFRRLATSIRKLAAAAQGTREEVVRGMVEAIEQENAPPFEKATALAEVYANAGETEKAIEQLREASRLRPQDSSLLQRMFNIALAKKETWPVAERECLPKLIEMGATRAGGRFHRGRLALAKAEAATRENDSREAQKHAAAARDEFTGGLQEFSSYPDGYLSLAQAQLMLKQYDEARQSLARALDLNPRHITAILLMHSLARFQGDEAQQQIYVRRLEEVNPNHPLVLQERQKAEDQADPASGIARRERLAQSRPKDVDNLLALASLYARTNQADKARDTYEKCRQLEPENLVVVDRYAAFLRTKTPPEPAAAGQLLQEVIQGLQDLRRKAGVQLMLARHLEELSQAGGENAPTAQQVTAAYEAAAKIHEIPAVLLDIAGFYERASQPKEAEARYRRALELSNNEESREYNRQARRALIQLLLASPEGRFTELEREIAAYGERFTDGYAQIAHSELSLVTGRIAEAVADMDEYVRQRPQEALGYYRRGLIQYQRGAIAKAIDDLRKAASFDAKGFHFEHRRLLARCLAEMNQPDMAIAQLRSILEDNRGVVDAARRQDVELANAKQLVELHIKQKQWTAAEAVLLARSRDPNTPNRAVWLALLSDLYTRQGNAARAVSSAREAVEASGMQPASILSFANLCEKVKRPQDLIQFVQQKAPAELRALPAIRLRLAEAQGAAGQPAAALEIYKRMLDGAESLADVRAVTLSMKKGLKDALETLKGRLASRPEDRFAKFAVALAQLEEADGYEAGVQAMNELLAGITGTDEKARAEKILILSDLCRMVHSRRDFPTARKLYEQLAALEPGDAMTHNNLAYLLLDEFKELQKALEHAELAVRNLPTGTRPLGKALVIDTLGWAHVLLGNLDMGIARLRQAISFFQAGSEGAEYAQAGAYYHLAEGYFRRSQASSDHQARADCEEAILACQHAWRLLSTHDVDDPDNLRKQVQTLAEKLQAPLEEAPPTTRAALAG